MHSPPIPWCQPDRPFALWPPRALFSTFVLPLPDGHPEIVALPTDNVHIARFDPAYLDARIAVQAQTPTDLATVSALIASWFSDLDGDPFVAGNAATLTRVLSVLDAVCLPEPLRGDAIFDFGFLTRPRFVPVPGGNVDTLLWLAWRYVWALAVAVRDLDVALGAHHDPARAAQAAFEFVSLCGTVPGHDFVRAADRAVSDDDLVLSRDPLYRWKRSVARDVNLLRRALLSGRRRDSVPRGVHRGRYPLVDVTDQASRRHNFLGFSFSAAEALSSVVSLLRLMGHPVALARRLVCPLDKCVGVEYGSPGLPDLVSLRKLFSTWSTMVEPIVDFPVDSLDGHFVRSGRDCDLDPSAWALAERDMARWVGMYAWYGVALRWGIFPGDPDSFERAGPRCMPTHCGMVFPTDVYRDPVAPDTEYRPRAGERSLSARLAEASVPRASEALIPLPPSEDRDAFPWHEPVHVPLPELGVEVPLVE